MASELEVRISEDQLRFIYGDEYDFFVNKILPNCYCGQCADSGYHSTITNYEAFLNDLNDVILQGFCGKCGSKIGRYLEMGEVEEYLSRIEKIIKKNIVKKVE